MDLNYQFRWQYIAYCLIDDLVLNPCDSLPGIRVLGKRYKVSALTIKLALDHLEDLGIIAPAQPGKRRPVNQASLKRIAALQNKKENRILFLSPAGQTNHLTLSIYKAFHKLCNRENLFLRHVEIHQKPSEIRIQITMARPRAIILYSISDGAAEVVSSLNIPTVGISTLSSCFPTFIISYSDLLLRAFQHAWKVGHHSISSPLWNAGNSLYEAWATKLDSHFPEGASSFSRRYNLPRFQGETAADYQAALRGLFRYTPPTCLILFDLSHYLEASSFFLREGLRIPEDISVILLSNDPLLADIVPSVAHFVLFSDDMMKQAFHALREQMDGLESHGRTFFTPVWVPGDSLAAPRS